MEFVYVTPREQLFPDCYPHGLVLFGAESWSEASFLEHCRADGFFVERERAEKTPAWKQSHSVLRGRARRAGLLVQAPAPRR